MKYQHKENKKVMEILKRDEVKGTMLIKFEDGKSISITNGTFKRWYKKLEDTPEEESEVVETPTPEDTEQNLTDKDYAEIGKEIFEEAKQKSEQAKKDKASKVKKEKTPRTPNPEVTNIIDYVFKQLIKLDKGIEVFTPDKAPKVRAFKLNGHMFARINIATSHVSICCRSKAISIMPTKTTNHMFDAIFEIKDLSNTGLIDTILKESFEYQKNKNTHKKEEK